MISISGENTMQKYWKQNPKVSNMNIDKPDFEFVLTDNIACAIRVIFN